MMTCLSGVNEPVEPPVDDPAIDKWQIDQTGALKVIIDDAIAR